MEGVVIYVNRRRGMFVIEIGPGDYTVAELREECELNIGARVSGPLHSPGHETIRNDTASETIDVIIQAPGMTSERAFRMASA